MKWTEISTLWSWIVDLEPASPTFCILIMVVIRIVERQMPHFLLSSAGDWEKVFVSSIEWYVM